MIKKTTDLVTEMLSELPMAPEPLEPKKLKDEVQSYLTDRLIDEFTAYYFYLNAGNWCNGQGFLNAGKFFINESNSELEHARKIQDYLISWNIQPTIPQVETNFSTDGLVSIINESYKLEYELLLKYSDNSKQCLVKDINTFTFLQTFLQIQNQSVQEYSDILNVLNLIDYNDKFQLLYFEQQYFK